VKTLPDNPNLDHLRQQAKDLLTGLRDSRPQTTLSEAQAALAQQYGFRTWPDLKGEVDRRTGKADQADDALARAIAEAYELGKVTSPMRSIARPDDSGRRWSLDTERGRWEVRTMDDWWPIVDADTGVELQEAAAKAGIDLPLPVRSRNGSIIEKIGDHTWRVDEWVHAGPGLSAPVGSAAARRAGQIHATLHGLALPVDRISPYHARRISDESWPELVGRAKGAQASWARDLEIAAPNLADLERIGEGVESPEPVLTHNALTPNNVRRAADGRLIVVGWEHVGGLPPSWELAFALQQWVLRNPTGARAMLDGYREVAGALPRLDLAMFRGATVSLANYVWGEVGYALAATTEADRQHGNRSVKHLLGGLPTRGELERLVALAAS
jgi:Ser/Thr protein kinase RdoA (MazF antagonist)